jgi:hypothetical protein
MKSTYRTILIFGILSLISISNYGQQPNRHEERREKYRAMKIAYFTENLDLTPEEAEKFWPVYNKHEKSKGELMKNRRLKARDFAEQAGSVSEEEAQKIIDQHIENRQKEIQLEIDLHKELKKILPATKIMKLYITEVQFREHMLRQFRGDQHQGQRRKGRELP